MSKLKEKFENMAEFSDMDELLQAHFKKRLLTTIIGWITGVIIAVFLRSYLFIPYICVVAIFIILMHLYGIINVLLGHDIKIIGTVVSQETDTPDQVLAFLKKKIAGSVGTMLIKTEDGIFFEVHGKIPKKLKEGNEITLFTHKNAILPKNDDTAIINYPYFLIKSKEQA